MFENGIGVLFQQLLTNIFVALIPGTLALWIIFGQKWKGWLLYIFSWFLGVGIISNWMFDLQFIVFGIGLFQYFILVIVLIIGFVARLWIKKESFKEYLQTLKLHIISYKIANSYKDLLKREKFATIFIAILGLGFVINAFIFTVNGPTYADDSFNNWNKPIVNMLHDGGVNLFGNTGEILGRGRLGYPIHMPIYKVVISEFNGGYNDIYNDLFQYLTLLFGLIFIVTITRDKTKNIFYSLLPVGLICSLPLVFLHSIEGYMELPSAMYSLLVIRLIYCYMENKQDTKSLVAAILFGCILAYIKLDGLVVYLSSIVISVLIILLLQEKLSSSIKDFFSEKRNRITSGIIILLTFLPFQIVRIYHGFGLNPSDAQEGGLLQDGNVHREIFDTFPNLFLKQDNYGLSLIIIGLIGYLAYRLYHQKKYNELHFILTGIIIFIILTLIFLLTSNYMRVLNQTTVNRVYTMVFVILFSFIGLYYDEHKHGK